MPNKIQIITPEVLDQKAKYLRLLVYGEPGTGKTWMAASACLNEVTSPVLFVEFRSQVASLRSNPLYRAALNDGRLVIISLGEYDHINHVYTYLFRGKHPEFEKLFQRHGPPKTVAIDSITELQRSEVLRVAGNEVDKFLTRVDPPEIQQWGELLNNFTLMAYKFYDLPMHVAIFGLEAVDYAKRVVGQAAKIVGHRLALQGQARRQFPGYALTLMRLERAPTNLKPPRFCVGYTSSVSSKTKEQTGVLPKKVYDPQLWQLAKLLEMAPKAQVTSEDQDSGESTEAA